MTAVRNCPTQPKQLTLHEHSVLTGAGTRNTVRTETKQTEMVPASEEHLPYSELLLEYAKSAKMCHKYCKLLSETGLYLYNL